MRSDKSTRTTKNPTMMPWLPVCLIATGLLTGCAAPFSANHAKLALGSSPSVTQQTLPVVTVVLPSLAVPPVTTEGKIVSPKPVVPTVTPDMVALKAQLKEYLATQAGTYGVYVIDLASGKGVGLHENDIFPTASTFKLPMSMYILHLVELRKADIDEKLTYTAADYEDGTGILQDSVEEGQAFTVRHLIELAITQSDNIATNMLLDRFGRTNVFAYMHELGGKVTQFDSESLGSTPKEMATYMRLAYGNKAIKNVNLHKFLLDLLASTAFDDRAAAGVPVGIKVAHKIGTLPNVVNDVALVYAPRRTFIVSVFSTNVDDDVAPGVITELTRRVYDFESNLAMRAAAVETVIPS